MRDELYVDSEGEETMGMDHQEHGGWYEIEES